MASSSWMSASKADPLLPYTSRELDAEDAEGAVLSQIESRRTASDKLKANDDEERLYRAMNDAPPRRSFKSVACKVSQMNSVVQALKKNTEKDGIMKNTALFRPRVLDHQEQHLLDHSALRPDKNDSFIDDRFQFLERSFDDSNAQSTNRRGWKWLRDCCNPWSMMTIFFHALRVSFIAWMAIPLAVLAHILYYYMDDPDLDFLPGDATLSWWLNFAARLCVTLGLTCFTQYIFIDCFLLATGVAGPLVTLLFLQAKGLPFVLATWNLLNLILIQGDNQFQRHWLHWTGLELYNVDTGYYVLESGVYLRLLLSGLIAGCLIAIKRTFVALYFGRQQLKTFQPRLEKLLAEIVILNEVGSLASKAQRDDSSVMISSKTSILGQPRVDFQAASSAMFSDDDDSARNHPTTGTPKAEKKRSFSSKGANVYGIKDLLVGWKEPVDKRDKSNMPTIRDILRFRHALSYLDDTYPFGEDFGPAANRDECIASSHRDFWLLMKLAPHKKSLPFDVMKLIAVDKEDTEDKAKVTAIRKLFRPNASNNITLLAFVQSCDTIYKHFRFFRASLSNANVISDAIERMMNAVFFFVLTLLLLSVMNLSPMALLFSITSLLVSVSFALGPSVSKYVEGMLLIVRRPYDLGDRIFFSSADAINPEPDVTRASWFVEDITLSTTKLRYARTNEVSTVNNWSIAGSRIVNCNRSLLATVYLQMDLHMSIFDNDNLRKFRDLLDKYVAGRPRTWDSVSYFRHDDFDACNERVKFSISVRHINSWQDAARIKVNRADLLRFLYETSKELSVQYEEPPPQQLLYYGGSLKEGEVSNGYKRNLLSPDNLQNPPMAPVNFSPVDAALRQRRTATPDISQADSHA